MERTKIIEAAEKWGDSKNDNGEEKFSGYHYDTAYESFIKGAEFALNQTTSQQQTIERLRELIQKASKILERHYQILYLEESEVADEIEQFLNTTEPIENFYCEHQKNGFMRCSKKCLACSDDI